jgi:ATP/maltotriose-dependent transcriptional regulator MalT
LGESITSFLSSSTPKGNLFLGVAALLFAQDGKKQRAVELLGLAFSHPDSHTNIMDKWILLTQSRAELETELGTEVFQAAWQRGTTFDLHTTARTLLSELNLPTASTSETASQRQSGSFSEREREILHLIADGLNSREVAHRLILSVGTVRWYLKQIYGKLDAHSRSEAIARARALELLT